MRPLHQYLVKPVDGRRYDNTKEMGGIEIITSTSEEDHNFSNRYAEVVALPLTGNTSGVKVGDILLVHHNVFKFYNDMKGRRKSGKSFLKEDLFLIDPDQFYMYKRNNEWYAYDRYCFVKPIKMKEDKSISSNGLEPLTGVLTHPNDYLLSQGLKRGDEIKFAPDSEYEFIIDSEIYYRVYDHMITIKI